MKSILLTLLLMTALPTQHEYYFLVGMDTEIICVDGALTGGVLARDLPGKNENFKLGKILLDSVLIMTTDHTPTITIYRNAPPRPTVTGILLK